MYHFSGCEEAGHGDHERAPDLFGEEPKEPAIDIEDELRAALSGLEPRAREILRLSYGLGLRLRDIARGLGLHESRVSQIRTAALAAARKRARLAGGATFRAGIGKEPEARRGAG